MERVARRDPNAIAEFSQRCLLVTERYFTTKSKDPHVRDDLVSKTVETLVKEAPAFVWRGIPIEHWMLATAKNVLRGHFRDMKRDLRRLSYLLDTSREGDKRENAEADRQAWKDYNSYGSELDDVEFDTQAERREVLEQLLAKMKPKYRKLLLSRAQADPPTFAALARELGISEADARQSHRRALAALRRDFGRLASVWESSLGSPAAHDEV
jgi:RNA polymerase sigma factor (sigma-70 family)